VVVALGITWILDGLEVTLADLMPRAALDAAAALVADDCRGLVDWDQYRLKLAHGNLL
jgi:hypothetical protein